MLVLAVPFFSMRLGSADAGSDPAGSTTRQAYDLLAKGFGPGYNGPLQLVAQINSPAQQAAFTKVTAAVAKTSGVVRVTAPKVIAAQSGNASVATADVYPAGSPQDASTTTLLHHLRNQVVPSASSNGLHVLIGGQTAIFDDFSTVLSKKLPLFIGVVVLLSFLLLTAVFRSLLIPAMAALMNLLTAGAAFGVITAVFQWGWAASLLGIDQTGPIEAFIPVMMFAIVFGLSMDYQVFLVSRIYEEWHRRGDNRAAVTHGLAATGATITAVAAIMVLVFGAFILGGERVIEAVINLVGDEFDAGRFACAHEGREVGRVQHCAGRIGGARGEHPGDRLLSVRRHHRLDRERPARRGGDRYRHRLATKRGQDMAVGRIAGLGDRDAIARLE